MRSSVVATSGCSRRHRRWLENPYWQLFTGEVFFQTALPCDPSSLVRWRQRLGEAGMEELLAQTIAAARSLQAITPRDLERVIVDTTVQEKAVAYPTDSRLLEVLRPQLLETLAGESGSEFFQNLRRDGFVRALPSDPAILRTAHELDDAMRQAHPNRLLCEAKSLELLARFVDVSRDEPIADRNPDRCQAV